MLEEQDPNQVNPSEGKTEDKDADEDHNVENILVLEHCGATHDDFGDPVNSGDQKKDELYYSRKAVKCFHV